SAPGSSGPTRPSPRSAPALAPTPDRSPEAGAGRAHEREAVARAPRAVESLQAQLPVARVAPEAEHVAAAEEAEPRVVEEDDRALALHLGMRDPEVERVLVGGPVEAEPRRLRDDVLRGDLAVELEQHDLP